MAPNDLSPLERLLAEAVPTGTFGHARPAKPPTQRRKAPAGPAARHTAPIPRWSPEEQARHVAELEAVLDGWQWEDDTSLSTTRRHLRLVRRSEAA